MLKGLFNRFSKERPSAKNAAEPMIITRSEHNISRKAINPNALKVLYRLNSEGYSAYLVGGCVRDLLLGYQPKDFDIATNAKPEEIRRLFKNCRLIGKRFRLAHIVFGKDIIEVATFRTHHENAKEEQHGQMNKGMIVRDNVYGSIEDDAWRRDFTINALYYDISNFSVVDYTNGISDIHNKTLRIIGQPDQRYHEDPVRMLRAIRLMGKLKLSLSSETEEPIRRLSYLLSHVSNARLFQEVLKFFQDGALLDTLHLLQQYQLLEQLFPQTAAIWNQPETASLIHHALTNTEARIKQDKSTSPAFLFTIFLWRPIQKLAQQNEKNGAHPYVALEQAIETALKKQTEQLAIPRLLQITIREICFLQYRLTQRFGIRPFRLLEHPRFRAAYDLLMLRAESGEQVRDLYQWWTQFQTANNADREKLMKEVNKAPTAPKRKRRPKRKAPLASKRKSSTQQE